MAIKLKGEKTTKKDLAKALVLMSAGGLCVVRGLMGSRYDGHDYSKDGMPAGVTLAINAELARQANNGALQMIAVGALVLLSSSMPWNEYKREKAERDEPYSSGEGE